MQRRKFLIGAGGTVIGASALIGSGAFNVSRIDRDISVEIVDDSVGYVGLDTTSEYADIIDGKLTIHFGDNSQGDGMNDRANFVFQDVFTVTNQGTNTVRLLIADEFGSIDWSTDFPRVYYTEDALGTSASPPGGDGWLGDADGNYHVDIDVGETIHVHLEFRGRKPEWDEGDLPELLGLYFEAIDG